jgi:hypothetical protein
MSVLGVLCVHRLHIHLCLQLQLSAEWAGLPPTRAAPMVALACEMEGMFLSSGILYWNSGLCQPVPCLLTINYLIYIH